MGYVLRFGVFELNLVTEELLKFGTPVRLPPQPFKVLALLASQAGQVVTREQIQFQVWGEEIYVDFEQGMNHCIKQIRNALSDTADTPRYIETLPRRGYRFIAPVEARKLPDETPEVSLTLIEPKANEPAPFAEIATEIVAQNASKSNSGPLEITDPQPSPRREPSDAVVSPLPEPPRGHPWRLASVARSSSPLAWRPTSLFAPVWRINRQRRNLLQQRRFINASRWPCSDSKTFRDI